MREDDPKPDPPYRSGERILSHEIEEPRHPDSRTLLKFWTARNHGGLPHRSQVACRELKSILPFLFLMEPADAAMDDWRYRVVGSAVMERLGMTRARGCLMSELHHADVVEFRKRAYQQIAASGKPRISRGKVLGIGRDFYEIEAVHAPIDGGSNRIFILASMFFFN